MNNPSLGLLINVFLFLTLIQLPMENLVPKFVEGAPYYRRTSHMRWALLIDDLY